MPPYLIAEKPLILLGTRRFFCALLSYDCKTDSENDQYGKKIILGHTLTPFWGLYLTANRQDRHPASAPYLSAEALVHSIAEMIGFPNYTNKKHFQSITGNAFCMYEILNRRRFPFYSGAPRTNV